MLPGQVALSDVDSRTTLAPDLEKSGMGNDWEDATPRKAANSTVECLDNKVDDFSVPGLLDEKFTHDYKSETLEAYKIDHSTKSLFPLPLGHLRLTHELNRTVNSGKGSVYNKIVSLDADRQKDLDLVISTVQKQDTRPRICLDFDFCDKQRGTVFFKVGAPVEPIHEKPVHLKDCTGRKYNIPFENCKLKVSTCSQTLINYLII